MLLKTLVVFWFLKYNGMIRKKVWFFPADGNTGELQQEISAVFNSLFFNWRLMLGLLAEARRKGLHYIRLTSANSALQVLSVAWIFILKVEREYCSRGRSQMTNRSCWLKRFANQFFLFPLSPRPWGSILYKGNAHFYLLDKITHLLHHLCKQPCPSCEGS